MSNDDAELPVAPVPDTKDWTWVVQRACPECGFEPASFDVRGVGTALRANADRWREVLVGADPARRPAPDVWSPLEYAGHVRDVCRIHLHRLELMLAEDDPLFANWDQDATAIEQRYDLADPAVVATELHAAADALATRFDGVADAQWARTGRRSDGAAFTVESFARYFIHDPVHHLHDVAGQGR